MDFDLRLLQHARALAEEGNFARAARTLHLTQPALSRSIQELERRTGVKLFDRNQGRVEPTDLGRVFLAQARELLSQAEALNQEVASMRGSASGSLVVGSGTFPTAMFMAEAASAFLCKNPQVAIRFVNDNWVGLVAALRRRELDFVVAAPPVAEDATDLAIHLLAPRQGYFLVRPAHPLVAKPALSLADIMAYPIICTGRLSAPMMARLLECRNSAGVTGRIPDVACESHDMMRRITAATDHVLVSALAANAASIAGGELVALPVIDAQIGATFAILRLQTGTLPPIADELIAAVIAADRATADADREWEARLLHSSAAPVVGTIPRKRRREAAGAAVR